jgi:histidine triad (HIT) family protein
MDCLFCKITKKEIPGYVLWEDANAIAVLDVRPRAIGHTMILPKIHVSTILELKDDMILPVFRGARIVTEMLERAFHPDGFTIGINHGGAAGQAIDHLHVHIIPRWETDRGGSIHSIVENVPSESLEEVRSKILEANI